jgi:methylmalonyl-CoA/ethylmalonyl-CoA epimerase
LLHPLGENSPIANFLQKRTNGGIHHICIEVKDIYASIAELQAKGITPLNPKPKTGTQIRFLSVHYHLLCTHDVLLSLGAHGKPVVFLNPKDCNGVLVELEEE